MSRRIVISQEVRRAARRALPLGFAFVYWPEARVTAAFKCVEIAFLADLPLRGHIDLSVVPITYRNKRPPGSIPVRQLLRLIRSKEV